MAPYTYKGQNKRTYRPKHKQRLSPIKESRFTVRNIKKLKNVKPGSYGRFTVLVVLPSRKAGRFTVYN